MSKGKQYCTETNSNIQREPGLDSTVPEGEGSDQHGLHHPKSQLLFMTGSTVFVSISHIC